ncbi:unnamed protein product [Pleuronectes platessa]|uniref:Uncharacterized protein n=1 Tax=Pleuronectes platessa TaxID=8262 RepID=A0A9N7UIH3_PLEPL|nr:unnamed protein product [Pleuronectes platessa]
MHRVVSVAGREASRQTATLSDYRVEQQHRLSYLNELSPSARPRGKNSSSEDRGEDKRVLQLNHFLVTEFNRGQNSVHKVKPVTQTAIPEDTTSPQDMRKARTTSKPTSQQAGPLLGITAGGTRRGLEPLGDVHSAAAEDQSL